MRAVCKVSRCYECCRKSLWVSPKYEFRLNDLIKCAVADVITVKAPAMQGAFLISISICRMCGEAGHHGATPRLTRQHLQIRTFELEGTALLDELLPVGQHQRVEQGMLLVFAVIAHLHPLQCVMHQGDPLADQ